MSEVLQYENRKNRLRTDLWGSFLTFLIGFFAVGSSVTFVRSTFLFIAGGGIYITSMVMLSMVYAGIWNGYNRAFWSYIAEPRYRPVKPWGDDLEARNAFERGEGA